MLGWALSGYSIASAALLLVAGRLSDLVSARRVFLTGIAGFALACVAAGLAPNVEMLIAARSAQGLATALVVPSSLTLALREFPASRVSMAVAIWGGCAAIAGASSAPISAAIVSAASWRGIFLSLAPAALLVYVLADRLLGDVPPPVRAHPRRAPLDLLGAPMGAAAVALIVAVVLEGADWGWTSPGVLGAIATSCLLMSGVLIRSRTHPAPLLDLGLFRRRRFAAAGSLIAVFNLATAGYWFATPFFLQAVWGWDVLDAGLAIAPGPLTHLLLARPTGRWADRGNHRSMLIAGCGAAAVALGMLAWRLSDSGSYWTDVFPWMVLLGAGGALSWATFTSAALVDIESERFGQANGVTLTVRQMGAALGVAIVIAVVGESSVPDADSFRTAYAVLAAAAVACAAGLAVWYPRADRRPLAG